MPFVAPLFGFGDSVIDAFNPTTWAFEGSIDVNPGAGNAPGGLWSMAFGGDGSGADAGWARSGEAAGVGNICFFENRNLCYSAESDNTKEPQLRAASDRLLKETNFLFGFAVTH